MSGHYKVLLKELSYLYFSHFSQQNCFTAYFCQKKIKVMWYDKKTTTGNYINDDLS